MWFEDWFSSKLYLELYSHRDDKDAREIINLLQRSIPINIHSSVLDIACGAGRHSLELAKRGFDVTGFDLSGFLISEAKKNLKNSKEKEYWKREKRRIREQKRKGEKGDLQIRKITRKKEQDHRRRRKKEGKEKEK